MIDFIGGDPESNASECPAVFVDSETGDLLVRGKTITDPGVITELNQHIGRAEDESDVWLPARLAPAIREAIEGYERGKQGPGQHSFAELLEATRASLIRFEMRDSYHETETGYAEWKATGDTSAYDWGDHLGRGPRRRRAWRPDTPGADRIRTFVGLHAVGARMHRHDCRSRGRHPVATSDKRGRPVAAGCGLLGIRPSRRAVELPARRRHQPARVRVQLRSPRDRDITAAFEIAWDRATPHAEYKP